MEEVREFLTGVREPAEPERVLATVLFTDIVGSTERARELGDRRWRDLIERHHELVRRDLARYRGLEIDTAGDGFLATFDGPARAIRSAKAIVESVRTLGLEIRAGLHTGEVELAGDAVRGIAVHTGARVASAAAPSEVLVSQTVKDLVAGAGIEFEDRGARELKGVPGEWRLYAVAGQAPAPAQQVVEDDARAGRRSDRINVAMARRAPWLGRSITRVLVPSERRRP
jgi:class 3 adenylate cyclase